MTALLGLRNLSKRFGYRTILQELNLDIQAAGEYLGHQFAMEFQYQLSNRKT